LRDVIIAGCSSGSLTTVAGKLDDNWREHYENFVLQLRNAGLVVNAFIAPRGNWHAKIAIRTRGTTPLAALLGSSNLTFPAYSEGRRSWNFECDVAIWISSQDMTDHFRRCDAAEDHDNIYVEALLDPSFHQPEEPARLREIQEDVLGEANGFERI
jgi:hypothetical protein